MKNKFICFNHNISISRDILYSYIANIRISYSKNWGSEKLCHKNHIFWFLFECIWMLKSRAINEPPTRIRSMIEMYFYNRKNHCNKLIRIEFLKISLYNITIMEHFSIHLRFTKHSSTFIQKIMKKKRSRLTVINNIVIHHIRTSSGFLTASKYTIICVLSVLRIY